MKESSNPEIEQIMSVEGNQNCVDCSAENPTFVSVNNAVLLCENCANAHKTLGKDISDVRSLLNEELSPEEITLLKLGGNKRFKTLISEYGITDEQNKEFKYHLNLADYYRKLLLAERNKDSNPEEYQNMLNSKPSPEIGLQILQSVANANPNQLIQDNQPNQPNQVNQENPQNPQVQPSEQKPQGEQEPQSELSKDASNLVSKITGFFTKVGNALNDTVHKYGIDEKIVGMKDTINREAKSFGEQHPNIQSAAETTFGAVKTAGTYVADTATKIANSEPVQKVSQKVSETYQGVINSDTVKNLSKKAEEQYVSLKVKLTSNNGNGNDNNSQPQQQQENNPPENKQPDNSQPDNSQPENNPPQSENIQQNSEPQL